MPEWARYSVSIPLWGLFVFAIIAAVATTLIGLVKILLGAGAIVVLVVGGTLLLPRLLPRLGSLLGRGR